MNFSDGYRSGHKPVSWKHFMDSCCVALLVFAILVSLITTYRMTESFLDGDAYAELVLAEHLARKGQFLSTDWYYSTELRVLNTQLIHSPLFLLFDDWHLVRFIGSMILQLLLVVSCLAVTVQAGVSIQANCISAALIILPLSTSYGRITLYHTYYAPHIIIGFSIVALYLLSLRRKGGLRALCLLLMISMSVLSGMGGIRQFVITHIPLLLLTAIRLCKSASTISFGDAWRKHGNELLFSMGATAAFLIGFMINDRLLSRIYWVQRVFDSTLSLENLNHLPDYIFGIAHQFGFRRNIPVISVMGLASLCGLFSAAYVLLQGTKSLCKPNPQWNTERQLVAGFFAASLLSTLAVSLLTSSSYDYTRHIIPSAVWAIPLLAICWDESFSSLRSIRIDFVFVALAICFLLGNGLVNAGYFSGHKIAFRQNYEGLYGNDNLVEHLAPAVQDIRSRGYTVGYSTRWESCTITEMTDGDVTAIPVVFSEDHQEMYYEPWLSLRSYQSLRPEKTFLMLPYYLDKYYVNLPLTQHGERIYEDERYVVYGFDSADPLLSYLQETNWRNNL